MSNWYESKIAYERQSVDGSTKKVKESYLVEGVSITDAETIIRKELSVYINGDFNISSVKHVKLSDIFFNEKLLEYKWFTCKVNFITLDENKGTEKCTVNTIMIQASNFSDALERLKKEMETTLFDYEIISITQTQILDAFKQ
jgi:hypothetical protein